MGRARSAFSLALIAGGLCFGAAPGCAAFGVNKQSTVAQGQYYSSGEPHYDEFFISLYLMQVALADAPHVPETERRALAEALSLPAETDAAGIGQRLREEAQKLSHEGIHLRLDQNPAKDKGAAASVTLRSSGRPKEDSSASLLTKVEQSGTNLQRSVGAMSDGEATLTQLEPQALALDQGVETAFANSHFGKQGEVRKNLADARQLIGLMHTRATEVRQASEQLLLEISKAVNTDDGSLGPPGANGAAPAETKPAEAPKKPVTKARPKAKPAGATGAPAPAPRPKPASDTGDAPAPASKPSKAPPAPRDFEP